jgi:1,4-dihydroxy-2-naphthoate octaprenyltransferase
MAKKVNQPKRTLRTEIISYARPWSLLAGVILYALGGGIVHYLGYQLNWAVYFIGQAIVTLLQASSYYLKAYYDLIEQPPRRRRPNSEEDGDQPVEVPRHIVLQIAMTTLSVGAVLTVLLIAQGILLLPLLVILGIAFFLSFFYAVPPLRLVYTGYGELVQAVLITNLVPSLAYLIQVGEFHRLLIMLTFPLTLLYLAMVLALSLRAYTEQMRQNRSTLMMRLGWQRGMFLHNVLVFLAYLLLVIAMFFNLPWFLTWPGLLTFPLGMYQVWQMNRIAAGSPPRWRILTLTAAALFGLTAYSIALALWTS